MPQPRPQRIRDPVHNLIEFQGNQFESALWRVIQTRPFQRLRRIRQLGFSEFVFPGATHSRFAHSIGVFHMARQLMGVIRNFSLTHGQQFREQQAQHALVAALVHDVGHGMFSHAFEALGKEYNWPMAKHELVSEQLIRNGEISVVLNDEFGRGYAENVADIIAREEPTDLYGSVVSSQFDADRLDYMQRDRLMTGVQSSGVDPTWLLANLEISEVTLGSDEARLGSVETLVLGPKAYQTAESYVLALFHLYPNVYLHKTTRGIEKLFQALVRRIVFLYNEGVTSASGLEERNPLVRFLGDPHSIDRALSLDDTVFWGALPTLMEADDQEVRRLASALGERKLLQCTDIGQLVDRGIPRTDEQGRKERSARVQLVCDSVVAELKERQSGGGDAADRCLVDQYRRNPYKRYQDSKSPLNQILIRLGEGSPTDMAELSPVIAHAETFSLCRAYTFRGDTEALGMIENIVGTKIREISDAAV